MSRRHQVSDARPAGSTALRIVLGRQLRTLRENAGLSYEQAGKVIFASSLTIRRMEAGETSFRLDKVEALLERYGIADARERETFLGLAQEANTPGWWHQYSDVLPPWFRVYVGLEEATSLLRGYEPQFVPGLLQTEDYARAVIRIGDPSASKEEIDRNVQLRMGRQRLLTREDAPRLWFVLDEPVLRRRVGGREVMRAQIARLIEATSLPNVTLQVMPFAAGEHPVMFGMFQLMRFPVPEMPDLVYGENLTSAFYLDKLDDVTAYAEALDRLSAQATPADETAAVLVKLRKEI